jgi:hypothetical protein
MRVVLKGKGLIRYIEKSVGDIVDEMNAKVASLKTETGTSGQPTSGSSSGEGGSGGPGSSLTPARTPAQIFQDKKEELLRPYKDIGDWTDAQYVGDARTMGLLMTHVGPEQLSLIESKDSAREQWEALRRTYQPTGTVQLVQLLTHFHGFTLRSEDTVDTASAKLTTIQTDIRSVSPSEAPSDQAKSIKLMDLFCRKNRRYEPVVLLLQGRETFPSYQEVVSALARMEERIKSSKEGGTDLALAANSRHRGKDSGTTSGRRPQNSHGNQDDTSCWHCGSKEHYRRSCPDWLATPEGTKWSARNRKYTGGRSRNQEGSSDNKGKGTTSSNPGPKPTGSPNSSQNAGQNSKKTEGAWAAYDESTFAVLDDDIMPHWDTWLLDSGATAHMTWDRSLFDQFIPLKVPRTIHIADGSPIEATGIGNIKLQDTSTTPSKPITVKNVLYAPDLSVNLLSVAKLEDRGVYIAGRAKRIDLIQGNEVLATAKRVRTSYILSLEPLPEHARAASTTEAKPAEDWKVWHPRFGHAGSHHFKRLHEVTEGLESPIDMETKPEGPCDPCIMSKHVRVISREKPEPETEVLYRAYMDMWGPYRITTWGGHMYFMTITDGKSRYKVVITGASRKELWRKFLEWREAAERETGKKLVRVRLDNAPEFEALAEDLREVGIVVEFTTIYSPDQNGIAERTNRTLVAMAKAMLFNAGLPQKLWGPAITTACYLRNRLPIGPGGITPFEAFMGRKPDISHLKTFGCLAYGFKPQEKRAKLDPNSIRTIFIGYTESTKQYMLYDPTNHDLIKSSNVLFYEDRRLKLKWEKEPNTYLEFPRDIDGDNVDLDDLDDADDIIVRAPLPAGYKATNIALPEHQEVILRAPDEPELQNEPQIDPQGEPQPQVEPQVEPQAEQEQNNHESDDEPADTGLRRTKRPPQPVRRLSGDILVDWRSSRRGGRAGGAAARVAIARPIIPQTYKSAMEDSNYSVEWKEAIQDELQKLQGMDAWEITKLPPGKKPIGCRWVFDVKYTPTSSIDKFKARLVAQGFSTTPGIDFTRTFSPTIRWETLRIILAMAAPEDWDIHQVDIVSAYLASRLKEDIYMKPPEGLNLPPGLYLHLRKALYGLKQSGRAWYDEIASKFTKYGLIRLESDWSVFTNHDKTLIVGIYVDDIIITGKNPREIQALKDVLKKNYRVTDKGELKWILGVEVIRDRKKRTIRISQSQYVRNLLAAYRMENAKPLKQPIEGYESLSPASSEEQRTDQQLYQQAIGSLLFLSLITRIDIAFVINKLSQFCSDPAIRHWNAVLRVFRYLLGTEDYYLEFGPGPDEQDKTTTSLVGYTDSDYASSFDRVSTSAYVFTLNGTAVSWASRRQRTIATSTVEAEYIALCAAAKHGVWLRNLFCELGQGKYLGGGTIDGSTALPIHIYSDSQGGLALADNPENHSRTKHIDVQYHYTRHLLATGAITTSYIPTERMLADILTKPLPTTTIRKHLKGLFGRSHEEMTEERVEELD